MEMNLPRHWQRYGTISLSTLLERVFRQDFVSSPYTLISNRLFIMEDISEETNGFLFGTRLSSEESTE